MYFNIAGSPMICHRGMTRLNSGANYIQYKETTIKYLQLKTRKGLFWICFYVASSLHYIIYTSLVKLT